MTLFPIAIDKLDNRCLLIYKPSFDRVSTIYSYKTRNLSTCQCLTARSISFVSNFIICFANSLHGFSLSPTSRLAMMIGVKILCFVWLANEATFPINFSFILISTGRLRTLFSVNNHNTSLFDIFLLFNLITFFYSELWLSPIRNKS